MSKRGFHTDSKGLDKPLIWVYDINNLSVNLYGLVEGAPFKTSLLLRINKRAYSTNLPIPVIKYENADRQKLSILEENKVKSGVYLFRNLTNEKIYIGSSMDLRRRFKEYFNVNHLLRNKNLAICAALGKYGYSLFSLEVLEYCDPSNILKREQYYLDLIKPQYNILKTAGSFVGFKHTEETKNKLAVLFKGNKNSQNHPAAVSVEVLDLESGETSIFSSARKAAVALNISNSTVMYKLRGNPSKTYKNRYIFNYTEKPRHFSVYLSRSPNTCCVNSFIIP